MSRWFGTRQHLTYILYGYYMAYGYSMHTPNCTTYGLGIMSGHVILSTAAQRDVDLNLKGVAHSPRPPSGPVIWPPFFNILVYI